MQTEYHDDYGFARSYMGPGETILWKGKPGKGNLVTGQDLFMIPFSIVWCGFALFWEYNVIRIGFTPFMLFGIPFVCMGVYLVVGRFFHTAWLRKRTAYVITNKKIIRARGNRIDMIEGRNMPPVQITAFRDGSGTVRIGYPYHRYRRSALDTNMGVQDFMLENVPNVALVQQMIDRMER